MNVFDELRQAIIRAEQQGMSLTFIASEANLNVRTIRRWLYDEVMFARLASMLRVARVLDKHIELTGNVAKMAAYRPKPRLEVWTSH